MANTVIQLKYSTVTATPTSLNIGEPAYSYTSNTFFIGSPDGTGSIAIGGKFYLDQQQDIYNAANAAFDAANNAVDPYASAHANAAFDAANTNAGNITVLQGVDATQNTSISNLEGVNLTQNTSISNLEGVNLTQNTNITTAQNSADAAFTRANNSLNANTGGVIEAPVTITANLNVLGNLTVSGNVKTIDTETLNITDPLIYLAANNYSSDLVDIGFVGNYFDGATQRHAGLVRHAADGGFYLFTNYDEEPDNNIIDINDPSFVKGTLNANLSGDVVTVGGVDLKLFAENAYTAANSSQASANYGAAHANAAFDSANTNATAITALQGVDLTQNTNITNAQNSASAAFNHANAAFDVANTDVTNISISTGHFGSATQVAAFEVAANGRIISANATAIAISADAITSGTLPVGRGGTGATTFTTNGVLLGQGTSAISTASSSTEGHVLTINDSGVPTFAMLQGGTF
jgi:hypothetical protein